MEQATVNLKNFGSRKKWPLEAGSRANVAKTASRLDLRASQLIALFAVSLLIVGAGHLVSAADSAAQLQPSQQLSQLDQNQAAYSNFVEGLIFDYLDAGDRLKKSRLNGARPVKHTLRFGRRSDPSWMPVMQQEQALEEQLAPRHLYSD